MKKALISTSEKYRFQDGTNGVRIAYVTDTEFPLAEGMFWFDCEDNVTAELHYFDLETNTALPIVSQILSSNIMVMNNPTTVPANQPTTTGTTTL